MLESSIQTQNNDEINALNESQFSAILLAIVIGWIIVSLWQRFVENLAFGTFGLNEDSSFHSFIVALAVTIIFITGINVIDTYDLIPGIEQDIESSVGDIVPVNEVQPQTTSNSAINQNLVNWESSLDPELSSLSSLNWDLSRRHRLRGKRNFTKLVSRTFNISMN